MDEMKIASGFTTSIVSKLIEMSVRKKLGYEVDVQLNNIEVTIVDGKTHAHMDIDAELEKGELLKILKECVGL